MRSYALQAMHCLRDTPRYRSMHRTCFRAVGRGMPRAEGSSMLSIKRYVAILAASIGLAAIAPCCTNAYLCEETSALPVPSDAPAV